MAKGVNRGRSTRPRAAKFALESDGAAAIDPWGLCECAGRRVKEQRSSVLGNAKHKQGDSMCSSFAEDWEMHHHVCLKNQ